MTADESSPKRRRRKTALALSSALLATVGTAFPTGVACAQTGTGTGTGGSTGGGQTGAPASGAPGTATPGANAPGTVAPTGAGNGQAGPAAAPAGAGIGGGMAAQDGGVSGEGASGGTGVSTNGSIAGTNKAPDSPNFDLARTIGSAIASSAGLIEAQRNVEIDRRRAKEAADLGKPTLTADASATRFDQATQVSIGPQKATVLGDHTEAISINAADRFDFFGVIRAQTSQANLQALADTFVATSIQNSRVLQAQTTYFTLLRSIHQVRVSEAALRNAQEQQTVARRLYEGQIGQKIDLLRANTQVATAQENLTAARNNRDIARASFNDLVGRPLDAPVFIQDVPGVSVGVDIQTAGAAGGADVSGTTPTIGPVRVPNSRPGRPIPPASAAGTTTPPTAVPPTADNPANADAGAGGTFVPYSVPPAETSGIDINQAITGAQAVRPEVLQQATLLRASNVGVRVARAGTQPTVSLSASGNYYPTPSFQYPRQRTGAVTLALSIPLYDGGLTRDRIAEARERTKNAETALDSTKEDVALQVRQDYLNLQTAARQIEAANTALQQAIAARQLAQVRYEGQVGLYLEVTDAQSALVQAENAQVDAVYNYLIARAQFENALGTPRVHSLSPATATAPDVPAATAPGTPTSNTPADLPPIPVQPAQPATPAQPGTTAPNLPVVPAAPPTQPGTPTAPTTTPPVAPTPRATPSRGKGAFVAPFAGSRALQAALRAHSAGTRRRQDAAKTIRSAAIIAFDRFLIF